MNRVTTKMAARPEGEGLEPGGTWPRERCLEGLVQEDVCVRDVMMRWRMSSTASGSALLILTLTNVSGGRKGL